MMNTIIRYTVKADRAEDNENYVRRVFEQLAREQPEHVRYATLKLEDGVSFVHLVSYDTPDEDVLKELDAFKEFTANIRDRCVEPPVSAHFTMVGSYQLFTTTV